MINKIKNLLSKKKVEEVPCEPVKVVEKFTGEEAVVVIHDFTEAIVFKNGRPTITMVGYLYWYEGELQSIKVCNLLNRQIIVLNLEDVSTATAFDADQESVIEKLKEIMTDWMYRIEESGKEELVFLVSTISQKKEFTSLNDADYEELYKLSR